MQIQSQRYLLCYQLDTLERCVLDFPKPVAIVVQKLCACRDVLSSINGNSVIAIHHLDLHSAVWLIAAEHKDTFKYITYICDSE